MNTKTDGISSGLVAVARQFQDKDGNWHPFIDKRHYLSTAADGSWPIRHLVDISDAEAIIVAKGAEIERLKGGCTRSHPHEEMNQACEDKTTIARLRAMLPDIPKRERECKTLEDWRSRALYFESEYAACSHGFNCYASKQSAALKLAREALGEVQGLIGESHGVYGLHLNGDESPWNELEQGGEFERLTSLNEALAAIDSLLKGE